MSRSDDIRSANMLRSSQMFKKFAKKFHSQARMKGEVFLCSVT